MRLDYVSSDAYAETVVAQAQSAAGGYFCIADVNQCVIAHDCASHRQILDGACLVTTDSTILQRARSVRYGVPSLPTLRGADLMTEICRRAADLGVTVGLLGGRNETILAALVHVLRLRLPSLNIVFAYSPPFRQLTSDENRSLIGRINESAAQILFVGLGCPKQEQFMATHRQDICATMIGVGAAFDFLSGAKKSPPAWVHRAGGEWFYRLLIDPRRLWRRYLLVAPRFVVLLSRDFWPARYETTSRGNSESDPKK